MSKTVKNKIVYGWYADNVPFYIGIGSLRRSQSKHMRNQYCLNKRSKAERENCFEVRILHKNLSWQQACDIEISLISLYGRVDNETGILTNMTDGGDGKPGSKHSKETKRKMSKARSGKNNPNWGKPMSQEQKDKIGRANSGRKNTHETIELMREAKKRGKHPRAKPVQTPLGLFECGADAAEAHDFKLMKISRWCRSSKHPDFYFS